jgi:hypothetical protein
VIDVIVVHGCNILTPKFPHGMDVAFETSAAAPKCQIEGGLVLSDPPDADTKDEPSITEPIQRRG